MASEALEIRVLDRSLEEALAEFFKDIKKSGDDKFFHPHPFTSDEAGRLAAYEGSDLYYVLSCGGVVLGYGMLRGWGEGFDVPSLGVIIHPQQRGEKLGRLFMDFLHMAARRRGAKRVRLKVYPDNEAALGLYKDMGYSFQEKEDGQFVGFVDL